MKLLIIIQTNNLESDAINTINAMQQTQQFLNCSLSYAAARINYNNVSSNKAKQNK